MLKRHKLPLFNSLRFYKLPLGLLILASCQNSKDYLEESNKVGTENIRKAQMESLGREESISIRPASDTLRKRLLVGQSLPRVDDASLGLQALTLPKEVKNRFYLEEANSSGNNLGDLWPEGTTILDLKRSLMVAAANSREYQNQKEKIFISALNLDLEHDAFRGHWGAQAQSEATTDLRAGEDFRGVGQSADLNYKQKTRSGLSFSSAIGVDLVKLLSFDKTSSLGLVGDLSVSMPLLRGSSSFVLSEPLRQAERDLIYAIYNFERYKKTFAVNVASNYLSNLAALDRIKTSAANYRSLMISTRRARRLADAGRLPEIQVDQTHQNELKARQSWVSSTQAFQRSLDQFKLILGIPIDTKISLDPNLLDRLKVDIQSMLESSVAISEQDDKSTAPQDPLQLVPPSRHGGPWEWSEDKALRTALESRGDLRSVLGGVHDAIRRIAVAEDDLRADLTLLGSGQIGSSRSLQQAGLANAQLRPDRGSYSLLFSLDLPLHRIAERNTYRKSWIALEASIRNLQEQEDLVKLSVRNNLRNLLEAREQSQIQIRSISLAERRVKSTELLLQAGRAVIRDLLEAQDSLVYSQDQKTSAIIRYKSAEWQLQADLGVLEVGADGLWAKLRDDVTSSNVSPSIEPAPQPSSKAEQEKPKS